MDDKQLHEVQYKAKKGGRDLQVYLYFDPENFRHVRTRYRLVRADQATGRIGETSGSEGTRYTLDEKFDNFGTFDGLNCRRRASWNSRFTPKEVLSESIGILRFPKWRKTADRCQVLHRQDPITAHVLCAHGQDPRRFFRRLPNFSRLPATAFSIGCLIEIQEKMIKRIISGGQTGVDQAALDAAIHAGIPHGGWMPEGRLTESGKLPDKYHLRRCRQRAMPRAPNAM